MKRRILHILNWDKYQARTDKELPWLKLWGRLFKAPWFQSLQDDEKFVTIALLDLARQFHNNIPEEMIFKEYLRGNYGLFMSPLRVFKLSQVLVANDFLSDNCPTFVEVEGDKIRQDKNEVGLTTGFEEFWNKYPRKVAKPQALKAFSKISPSTELLQLILAGVENQSKSDQWTKDDGKYIPHPATWLNQQRWEDEVKIGNPIKERKPFGQGIPSA